MSARAETGVMQFEDEEGRIDWPGVFIRGDNAAYYAMALRSVLGMVIVNSDPISTINVQGLIRLLESSDTRSDPNPQRARLIPNGSPTEKIG
jgi:hypothetical protein